MSAVLDQFFHFKTTSDVTQTKDIEQNDGGNKILVKAIKQHQTWLGFALYIIINLTFLEITNRQIMPWMKLLADFICQFFYVECANNSLE